MATIRNKALLPLKQWKQEQENLPTMNGDQQPQHTSVLFVNDVRTTAEDMLRLIGGKNSYDMMCGTDFEGYGLYDLWVARDVHGQFLSEQYQCTVVGMVWCPSMLLHLAIKCFDLGLKEKQEHPLFHRVHNENSTAGMMAGVLRPNVNLCAKICGQRQTTMQKYTCILVSSCITIIGHSSCIVGSHQ
jgi:hypothetical protein